MRDIEQSSFKRLVSDYWDSNFPFVDTLFRHTTSKWISSPSVILYKIQCLLHQRTRILYPMSLSSGSGKNNEVMDWDHSGAEKPEDFVQSGASQSSNRTRREGQLDKLEPNELGYYNDKIGTLSLAALKGGLVLAFIWKLGYIPKASPFNQYAPDVSMHHTDGSRLHGILIGIDSYESHPLHGCVSDALAVRTYLTEDLRVPKEQIQCLLSPGSPCQVDSPIPSRENIISTLLGLVDDPQIQPGDGIIIYFSGHGSSYPCTYCQESIFTGDLPERDCPKSLCPIEALCPIDHGTRDSDNKPIPDISDREFNAVVAEVYRAKASRITVILDCCHTANLNRSVMDKGARAMPPLPRASFDRMLHDADQNLERFPEYHSILDDDWLPNMDSHVILAPCREYQVTKEIKDESGYHGAFTQSLLRTLQSGRLTNEATYTDLIDVLPWSDYQTPVVAGKRKSSRLWYQD